ncbi:CBS domain-containing protein [Prauserella cavernicola]|uniref:CBS domain-containing protein n=1 Tax=Prauserella cavernicola TaxID=2800127 RepID=A0A934QVM9_9PSEU|nr:CBS domain-containing protein [Prauserella cavernicola]MBK1787386.1 CBS domain-containing protein [Prauserella cavernicola]
MHARDIMSRPVVTVYPDTTVLDAIALLLRYGFAALLVVDEDDHAVGIFTEADALRAQTAASDAPAEAAVASSMTSPVEVVTADTDVVRIGQKMLTDGLRCIPVVDDGVLVGVVSRRDLLHPLVRQDDAIAAQLRGLLADYDGHRHRWTVEVAGGMATIRGEFADAAERSMLDALAKTVPGVLRTQLLARPANV